jgi:hypothetical protein
MVGTLEENGVLRILLGSPAVVPEGTQLLNGLPASCPDGFVDHEIEDGQPFFFEVSAGRPAALRLICAGDRRSSEGQASGYVPGTDVMKERFAAPA